MRRTTNLLALPLLAALAVSSGCMTDTVDTPSEPAPTSCDGRLTQLVDDTCAAVTVQAIQSEEITFERAGLTLHGTITWPQVEGEYLAPGVVLVHGSGPHGRNGALDGSLGVQFGQTVEIHRDLAEKLAWRGVATLRYDKRSCFKEAKAECPNSYFDYPGDIDALVVDDFLEDARSAAHRLAEHPNVRDDDIIIAGHSQGGNFVPRLVQSEDIISGGIGLGSPAFNLTDTIVGQIQTYADHLSGLDAAKYAGTISQLQQLADDYAAVLPSVLDGSYTEPTFEGAPPLFWQSWNDIMITTEADVISCGEPLLYLSGEWDFNVWPAHLDAYASWAPNAAGPVQTQLLTGLTHAFVPIAGTPPEDITVDPQFSPEAVEVIVGWLVATE